MKVSTPYFGSRAQSAWSLLYLAATGLMLLAGFGGNPKPILAQNSTGPTNIAIGSGVQQAGVKRLGINMSGQTYYDSGIMMRNMTYANSGFEGETWQSILKCSVVNGHTCADADLYAAWPVNFMKGATYEFIYGQAKGQTGTVLSSTKNNYGAHQGPTYDFGTATPAVGDVFILKQANVPGQLPDAGWWPGLSSATATAETTDLSPNTKGHQALWLNAMNGSATETSYFDTLKGRSFSQLKGTYTLYFRAKSVGGSTNFGINVTRLGTSHGSIVYLNQTATLTNNWKDYSYTFTANEDGTYIGPVQVMLNITHGSMYLDDAYVEEAAASDNPTAYRNAVVDRLRQLNPGVIRYMDNGADFGSSIDNMLLVEGARVRTGYGEGTSVQSGVPVGLEDFLVLCQAVGAEPWYTMPAGMSTTEMDNLLEFLNGSSSSKYGQIRASLGQTAPWTSVFSSIHLELGNETWNTLSFAGEMFGDPFSYGSRVGTIFGAAKASPNYVSGKIDLVADGWGALPWWNYNVMVSAKGNYDTIDVAPYTYGSLNDTSSNEAIYGPMFAQPEMIDSLPSGYMYQQMQTAATAAKPAKLAVYEVNLGTTEGTASQSTLDAVVPSVGAGISVAEHMLLMMRDDGVLVQNMFALPEYSNGFSNPNQGGENVKLWGTVVDMGGQTNLCRPQFLAVQLANTAIFGNMLTTVQTGNNPTWSAAKSANSGIVASNAHYIQSMAFADGNENSVVVFNLSRDKSLPVTFSGANAPTGTVQVGQLTSGNLTDTNETQSNVSIVNSTINNFNATAGVTLPPFSMTVYTWGPGSTQLPPTPANTTTSLTASPTTATTGQTVTLTATVAATNGSATPAGNVIFYDGYNSLGTTALANGKVTLNVSTLTAGSHSLTAAYIGDQDDNASTSTPVLVTVNPAKGTAVPTSTTLQVPSSVTQGSSATFTAKVTASSGSTPTGTVSFLAGQTVLGTAQLSNGTAAYTGTITLTPGQYSIVASYAGTSTDSPSTSSASTMTVNAKAASTTTALSAASTRITEGQTASVTATVTASSGGVPTGTVLFYIDNTVVANQQLSNGKTTYTAVVNMNPGTYQIYAKYVGTSTDSGSVSPTVNFTVVTNTSTNINSSATQVVEGSPVALTASVVPQTGNVAPTGGVTFYLGQTALGTQQLTAGQAADSPPINLPPGQYPLTAVYTGDTDDNGSTSNPILLTVTAASTPVISTNTTLTATPTQLAQGQSMQLAALVTAASGSTPTGSISFYLGQTQLGQATLAAGAANVNVTATMAPGTYPLTAVYAGTSQDSASSSAPIAITITPSVVATTTTLVSSASQLVQGQSFSLNATVAAADSSIPQGNVNFYLGQTQLGSAALTGGQATWTGPASFAPGSYAVTAIYSGSGPDDSSTSAPVTITIASNIDPTTTTLAASASQLTQGQSFSLSATVANNTSTAPTGNVNFFVGQTQLGTATLSGGLAAWTGPASFAPGTYAVTAVYAGDAQDTTSTSAPVSITVAAAAGTPPTFSTTTVLTLGAPQVTTGQTMVLAVTVAEQGGSSIPAGPVSFYLGQTQIGTALLANGAATLSTIAPAAGSYMLTASYAGQGEDLASQSLPVALTVQAATAIVPILPPTNPSFTMGLSSNTVNLDKSQPASLQVLLSAVQGYQGAVQLSCSGLPAGVSCSFSPATVNIQAANANSTLSLLAGKSTTAKSAIMTNVTWAMQLPYNILGLFGLFSNRRRSRFRFGTLAMLLIAISGGLVAMTGCGLTINSITQPYQVSVTAVGANQQSQTQSFTLYVTGPAAQF